MVNKTAKRRHFNHFMFFFFFFFFFNFFGLNLPFSPRSTVTRSPKGHVHIFTTLKKNLFITCSVTVFDSQWVLADLVGGQNWKTIHY